MKKIGRIGKINIEANRILKQKFLEAGITTCEAKLHSCMTNFALSFAHKHKRVWYKGNLELLSSMNEVILTCASCHATLEIDQELTEKTFKKLRE